MSPISDKIITLQNKEQLSYNALFKQMYPGLCVFAQQFLVVSADSEDLVQEVFLRFWDKFDNFDSLTAIKAFLFQATRNSCLNLVRHEKIKQQYEAEQIKTVESESYFLKQVLKEETNRIITQSINELPAKYRKVIQLSLKGMVNEEIANNLNLSVNTIKSQKIQAYKLLRTKLQSVFDIIHHLMMI
ncbi:RNA polymerase sigma-70 factor [Carboxylicivirga sp. N1Y90]|uniref:RNA polymerase sigma-70 factor n=1 Tax=Carboxylicivirga fragile TaxID=3417571 RepID=UPI003D334475|nr:RNA polymerase sigma-70 factor [Marinilabiliaceae bacterium N1Y90]